MKITYEYVSPSLRGLWLLTLLFGFQFTEANITIDGDLSDWGALGAASSAVVAVDDLADLPDANGDIRQITAAVEGEHLMLTMTVEGVFGPQPDQTAEGKTNRHYYHWLVDSDNNPATGFSNSEYEGEATNLQRPLGADLVIQIGWRDGKPNGIYAYDPLTDEQLIEDYEWSAEGNTASAKLPLASLNLSPGQTVSFSAFQEGASDGWQVDWVESSEITLNSAKAGSTETLNVDDPADLPDANGDIRQITAAVEGDHLMLTMTVEGVFGPQPDQTAEGKSNRHYYHWLVDSDNDPATGFSNSEYEGEPTGLQNPIGADLVIQIGWRDGAPNGVNAYDPLTDKVLIEDYEWSSDGATASAAIPLAALNLASGQTVSLSAFQEGASDGWLVDWIESVEVTLSSGGDFVSEGVEDPSDLPDANGDIREITAAVAGGDLKLSMRVKGAFGPTLDETAEGKTNRYYYHWLVDTDNDPATGFSNSEYEGEPTNLQNPLGADLVIQIGWRDGMANGINAYDPLTDTVLVEDYQWSSEGDLALASIPLASLGLTEGQMVGISAFQEGASDGWLVDWVESFPLILSEASSGEIAISTVEDAAGDLGDPNGDITSIQAIADETHLYLGMTVKGVFSPTPEETADENANRHYYHWILDVDNDPATGFSNVEYEGQATNLERPIGADLVIQLGWRNGAPNGLIAYDPLTDRVLVEDYEWSASDNTVEARIALADLELAAGQTVGFSAFQEGQSNGWQVDWVESVAVILSPPSADNLDLTTKIVANAFGYEIQLEDQAGAVLDTNSVELSVDGQSVEASAVKTDGIALVSGLNTSWLAGNADYRLRIEYSLEGQEGTHVRDFPFSVSDYALVPSFYAANSVDTDARGFIANITQISENQADANSAHNNQSALAERQLRGELQSRSGKVFVNEANADANGWQPGEVTIEGLVNWHEDTSIETGHFKQAMGIPDQEIPLIPGSEDSNNGIVAEILTYLELDAGFHRFGVNTTSGFKATMGPDGRDVLAPVLGEFNGSRNYSYQGDHYFNVLAEEPGFYPVRVLWFHTAPTKEGAQLEFYSIKDKRRILINDATDPLAVKAYRAAPTATPYISKASPASGNTRVAADNVLELEINASGTPVKRGSIELWLDGERVTPLVTGEGTALISVSYDPGVLPQGSEHQVEFAYVVEGNPDIERRERYKFGVNSDAMLLPMAWAGPDAEDSGFAVRSVQSTAARGNSLVAAEAQLASAGDFLKSGALGLINLSTSEAGLFSNDDDLDGWVSADSSEYFTMEAIAYLHLSAGVHTFGVNSDDGFALSAGATPTEQSLALMSHEGGRGISDSDPQNLVDVLVRQKGDYAFRLVYYQGTGDAAVEWFTYNRGTGVATLVNDLDNGGISASQEGHRQPLDKRAPELAAPSEHRLRALQVGDPVRETSLYVYNASDSSALKINATPLSGPDAALFSLDDVPASIAPQESGQLRISFRPEGRLGSFRATLEIGSDSHNGKEQVTLIANAVDPAGPIAHYRFDNDSMYPTFEDATGYERHGDFIVGSGSAQIREGSLAEGTVLSVAGGGHARVDGHAFDPWNNFTISAWVQADSIDGTQTIFAKGNADEGEPTFALLLAQGTLTWFVGSEPEFATDALITANAAYHVAIRYRNTGETRQANLFVDGVEVAAQKDPRVLGISKAFPFYMGSFDSVLAFAGSLDDVQIYDRALTDQDLLFLKNNPGITVSAGEVDLGPDPEPSDAVPVLGSLSKTATGSQLQLTISDNVTYDVEYSETLEPGSWQVIGSGLSAATFDDADANRNGGKSGFYRVVGK